MRKLLSVGLAAATLVSGATALGTAAQAQPVVVERYGHWDDSWGHRPPPPVARWHRWRGEHRAEWYGHVHTCAVKYTTYDARRDMYREGRRWVSCRD